MEHLRFLRIAEEASAECRNAWIEDRIRLLADSFAVSVYSYAVMSNHTHIVLHVDPNEAQAWSDEEVARCWLAVFPGALSNSQSEEQKEYIARLKERLEFKLSSSKLLGRPLKPVVGLDAVALLGMTEASYLDLVQWTGEQAHPMKRGKLNPSKEPASERPPEIFWSLVKHPKQWTRQVQGTERLYYRAIGSAEALMAKAADIGQRWMKGVSGERAWLILKSQTE